METSQPFTVSRGTIFKSFILCPRTGWLLWIVFAIGLTLLAVGCFIDIRYILLGLIVCLTVVPTVAFFLFVNYMFASEIVANLLNHTVERRSNGFLLRIFRSADPNDPKEKDKEWIESGRLTLFDSNILRHRTTSDYEMFFFKDSPLTILYVPRY